MNEINMIFVFSRESRKEFQAIFLFSIFTFNTKVFEG